MKILYFLFRVDNRLELQRGKLMTKYYSIYKSDTHMVNSYVYKCLSMYYEKHGLKKFYEIEITLDTQEIQNCGLIIDYSNDHTDDDHFIYKNEKIYINK